jgi:hypothetical protein
MSVVNRRRSKITFFNNDEDWERSRVQDIIYDYIDDNHIRIYKLFPQCMFEDDIDLIDYRRFHLRIYLPQEVYNDKYQLINKCFICFNGLNELTHFNLYDQIGKGLAKNGYGMILLPLPDHLNRNPQYRNNSKRYKVLPSNSFIEEPENIFKAFKQIADELKIVIEHLRGGCKEDRQKNCCAFFRRFFNPKGKISLIGYSLGGLVALSNSLILENEINSCILLNSGAKLEDIDVREFVVQKDWEEMVKKLQISFLNYLADPDERNFYSIFDMTFLGNQRNIFRDQLEEYSNKLLFILGGSDSVTKYDSIESMEPRDHGLSILKIPGIHHFLAIDTNWDRWFPIVLKMIISFDESASKSSLWPNDILWSLLKFQLKYHILDKHDGTVNFSKISDKKDLDVLYRTLFTAEASYGNMCEVMIEMYILLYRAQKNPHLYRDINPDDFNFFFGAKVIENGGSLKTLRDFLKIQQVMAQESEEVIPLKELYFRHNILTKRQISKLEKTRKKKA